MISKVDLGQKIKILRETRRMSQEELGQKLSKTHAAISYIESGKSALTVKDLGEIADVLGVTVADLLSENTEPQPLGCLTMTQFRNDKDITPSEEIMANRVAEKVFKMLTNSGVVPVKQ